MFLVGAARPTEECGTIYTAVLGALTWVALVSWILAPVVGVVALVLPSQRSVRGVVAIAVAIIGVPLFLFALNTLVCSESAA